MEASTGTGLRELGLAQGSLKGIYLGWALNRCRVLAGGQRPPEEGECTKAEVKVLRSRSEQNPKYRESPPSPSPSRWLRR